MTPRLSPRQWAVLSLLMRGGRTKEISTILGITEDTVKMHIAAAKTKLGASTTAQACVIFYRDHYVELSN